MEAPTTTTEAQPVNGSPPPKAASAPTKQGYEKDLDDRKEIIGMLKGHAPTHTREQAIAAIAAKRVDKIRPLEYATRQVDSVQRFMGRSDDSKQQWRWVQTELDRGAAAVELPHLIRAQFPTMSDGAADKLAKDAIQWREENPERAREYSERRERESQDRQEARELLRDHPREEVVQAIAEARSGEQDPQAYAERIVAAAVRSDQARDDWRTARDALRSGTPREQVIETIAETRKEWRGAREHAEKTVGKVEASLARDEERLQKVAHDAGKMPPPQPGMTGPERTAPVQER